jgi:hypothetical protein
VARVEAAPFAPQPFAVEQVGSRELYAHAGALQPLDRLLVAALGGVAIAEQCARAGLDAERPIAAAGPGADCQPLERPLRDGALAGAGRRLHELGNRGGRAQLGIRRDVDGLAHRDEGLLVVTQTVVQHGAGLAREPQREALPARLRVRGEVLDQRRELRLAPAQRREPDLDVAMSGDAGHRGGRPDLVEQRLRRGQLAAETWT